MTLGDLTQHDAGIIVYNGSDVCVLDWGQYGDNQLPVSTRLGAIPCPDEEDVFKGASCRHVKDFRRSLPGKMWVDFEDGALEIHSDFEILSDENNDLVRIFFARDLPQEEYEATVYTLKNGIKIIAPDMWN